MNRRAFGLVQLFAILILLLVAIIFVVKAVVNYKTNEQLAPEATADLKNIPATIMLHNLLITPVDTAPESVTKLVAHPTIADLIALDVNASDAIAAVMMPVENFMGKNMHWTLKINRVSMSFLHRIENRTYCDKITRYTATTTIPSENGEKQLTLTYCYST